MWDREFLPLYRIGHVLFSGVLAPCDCCYTYIYEFTIYVFLCYHAVLDYSSAPNSYVPDVAVVV